MPSQRRNASRNRQEGPGGDVDRGDWIAATQPVSLPDRSSNGNGSRQDTDLLILVQVKSAAATDPVRQLGRQLALDALAALGVVIVIVLAQGGIVFRISRERRWPWRRRGPNSLDSTPPLERTTPPSGPGAGS